MIHRDADTRVLHRDNNVTAFPARREHNLPAAIRVFRRVHEDVPEHLHKASQIAFEEQLLRLHVDRQHVTTCFNPPVGLLQRRWR